MIQEIHEKGKRANNEDYVLSDTVNNLFLVCDGVGGSSSGEEASKIAAHSFRDYLSKKIDINADDLNDALLNTEDCFDDYIRNNPASKGMATTMVFLHLYHNGAALAAHCGDSRIYQIRDGKIIFKTKDHSFVQELVDSGYITAEEALKHPKRNRITRAITGRNEPSLLDVSMLETAMGDYFLLCTDGILEGINDSFIEEEFTNDIELSQLQQKITTKCFELSNDNFSAILIKI